MGPWFYNQWPRNSSFSWGGPGQRTDPLLPPRVISGMPPPSNPGTNPNAIQQFVPNYSRYMGDLVGLKSLFLLDNMMILGFGASTHLRRWEQWSHIVGGGGFLVLPNASIKNRYLEIAAIAPDMFDAYHYSIQPDFFNTYWKHLQPLLKNQLGYRGFGFIPLWPDLGYSLSHPTSPFSVKEQIGIFNSFPSLANLFYVLPDPNHLLTSWTLDSLLNYPFPHNNFGKCHVPPLLQGPFVAGNCIAGGRSGYSVKMVSRSFLESPNLPLGGANHEGNLYNPPSSHGF